MKSLLTLCVTAIIIAAPSSALASRDCGCAERWDDRNKACEATKQACDRGEQTPEPGHTCETQLQECYDQADLWVDLCDVQCANGKLNPYLMMSRW